MKYLLVAVALMALVGCGGGSGSTTTCTFSDPVTPTYDLNGQYWVLSGETPINNCPYPNYTFYVEGTFSQNGNTITVQGDDVSITGQISDGQIRWGGTIQSGGETITIECTTMVVNGVDIGDEMTFTNTSWTVDYGDGICSGTADGTFTRVS